MPPIPSPRHQVRRPPRSPWVKIGGYDKNIHIIQRIESLSCHLATQPITGVFLGGCYRDGSRLSPHQGLHHPRQAQILSRWRSLVPEAIIPSLLAANEVKALSKPKPEAMGTVTT